MGAIRTLLRFVWSLVIYGFMLVFMIIGPRIARIADELMTPIMREVGQPVVRTAVRNAGRDIMGPGIRIADEALSTGDFGTATRTLTELIATYGKQPELTMRLGKAKLAQAQIEDAAETFNSTLFKQIQDPDSFLTRSTPESILNCRALRKITS